MKANWGKPMRFYQPPTGGAGGAVNILISINAQLQQLNQTVSALQNLQNTAVSVSTASSAAIGAWGSVFDKVTDGVIAAAKKAGEAIVNMVESSVKKAADIQTQQFPLAQMLRDQGAVAQEVLGGIHSLWQDIGVVSDESLSRAATNLALMNVPAQNIVSRLMDMSKMAVDTGISVDHMTAGYERLRQAIESDTAPAVRGMGAFAASTLALMQALEDHFGVTEGRLKAMFQAGQVSINDLNVALHESTNGAGRFADAFEQKKATFQGAIDAMKTAWQGLQVQIGEPIIDALTPLINGVVLFERRLGEIATASGWQIALKAAWEVLLREMALAVHNVLLPAFVNIGVEAGKQFGLAFIQTFLALISGTLVEQFFPDRLLNVLKEKIKNFTGIAVDAASPELEKAQKKLQDALDGIWDVTPARNAKLETWIAYTTNKIWTAFQVQGPPTVLLPEVKEDTVRADSAKQLSSALHDLDAAMNKIKQTQSEINAAPFVGADQKQLATINATRMEMAQLKNEIAAVAALRDSLPLNAAQSAELNARIDAATAKFKVLQLTLLNLTHPLQGELQRWANSFGTVAQQVGKTIESTIGAALSSVNEFLVTGKFNAQQLLQQIARLGLQLIENLIIQRVMAMINSQEAAAQAAILGPQITAAMAGAATAMTIATHGEAAAQAPASVGVALTMIKAILGIGSGTLHSGGAVSLALRRFHSGGLAPDEVPIIAQTGEIMIQRSVAQQPGMADFLLALNAGYHVGGRIRRMHGGSEEGVDIPPADYTGLFGPSEAYKDMLVGPAWARAGLDPSQARYINDLYASVLNPDFFSSPGYFPPTSTPGYFQGPTMIPTTFNPQGYPMAVAVAAGPIGGDYPTSQQIHATTGHYSPHHLGGQIGRMHSGGGVGSAMSALGGVHIYAFTDLKELTKHMASREGQKIIFDTVKGRRVDLGIK
jgi:hypothetical protein